MVRRHGSSLRVTVRRGSCDLKGDDGRSGSFATKLDEHVEAVVSAMTAAEVEASDEAVEPMKLCKVRAVLLKGRGLMGGMLQLWCMKRCAPSKGSSASTARGSFPAKVRVAAKRGVRDAKALEYELRDRATL